MAAKADLDTWVRDALRDLGGRASIVEVAKTIWKQHETDLLSSGNLFFTWQYDMRWAANRLRRRGAMKAVAVSPSGIWELAKSR
jgi:hypothetical protein